MRKIFAALATVALLAISSVSAKAEAMVSICSMTMLKNGSTMTYAFSRTSDSTFSEYWVERNGTRLTHNPYSRPMWFTTVYDNVFSIYYGADPSYVIKSNNFVSVDRYSGIGTQSAWMFKNGTLIATGSCTAQFL